MTETLLLPSRRSVVRAAAWSVPVVSIAAAAPAFAASLSGSTMTSGTPVKWGDGSVKHVSWDLSLTTGATAVESVSILFSYSPRGNGTFATFAIRGYAPKPDASWGHTVIPAANKPYTVNATHGAFAPSTTYPIHLDFAGEDNARGTVTATVTIKYAGVATPVQLPVITKDWDVGSEHIGH